MKSTSIVLIAVVSAACSEATATGRPGVAASATETVLETIGTASGPAMLTRRPATVTRDGAGGYLIADGNELIRIGPGYTGRIGRRGQGPGEYTTPIATRIDAQGSAWLFELTKPLATRFSTEGAFVDALPLSPLGMFGDAAFMTDGTLVVSGSGVDSGAGHRLHIFHPATRSWTSHMPYDTKQRDPNRNPYVRWVEPSPDGNALLVDPNEYVIEKIDPATGNVLSSFRGGGEFWDGLTDAEGERPIPPVIGETLVNPDGTVWVFAMIGVNGKERARKLESMSAEERDQPVAAGDDDRFHDSLLELVDLEQGQVIRSIVLPRSPLFLVGSEPTVAYYKDLPFPSLDIVRISTVP